MVNDASAKADVPVIQHCRLARGDGPLGLREMQRKPVCAYLRDLARGVRLAVARFSCDGCCRRRCARDPAGIQRLQLLGEQPRVVMALHDPQGVVLQVLAGHEPRGVFAAAALRAFGAGRSSTALPARFAERGSLQPSLYVPTGLSPCERQARPNGTVR